MWLCGKDTHMLEKRMFVGRVEKASAVASNASVVGRVEPSLVGTSFVNCWFRSAKVSYH